MSNKNAVMFKTVHKGYDKKDVNNYITDMNLRFKASENAMKSRIAALESESSPSAAAGIQKASEELERLRAENEMLRSRISELEKRLEGQQEADISGISSRLGDIIIKANIDADKLVRDAESRAVARTSQAEKAAEEIKFDAAVRAGVIIDEVKKQLSGITDDYLASLSRINEKNAEECKRISDDMNRKIAECCEINKSSLNK